MFINITKINRLTTLMTGALTLLFATSLSGCQPKPVQSKSPAEKPISVALVEAKTSDEFAETVISGSLTSNREAIVSAEVGEKLISWPVKIGEPVRAGQPIASLDSRLASAQLAQAEAQLVQARAAKMQLTAELQRVTQETLAQVNSARAGLLQAQAGRSKAESYTRTQELNQAETRLKQALADEDLAAKELSRFTELVREGAASQQTLDQVRAKFTVSKQTRIAAEEGVSLAKEGARSEDKTAARAAVMQADAGLQSALSRPAKLESLRQGISAAEGQIQAAQATVRLARINLGKHTITAPFSGRVLLTYSELGEMVSPGKPLLSLGETRVLKLKFSLPETARTQFKPGPIAFTLDSFPNKKFTGNVASLGFTADSRARAFAIEGSVDNSSESLLPGMVAKIHLPGLVKTRRVLIPADALVIDGTTFSVYVFQTGKAEKRRILMGGKVGDEIEVLDGLNAGEKLIRSPKGLSDGAFVEAVAK